MALPQGIAFRNTAGYVTDGANDYGETAMASTNYPTTSTQGNNVGWETGNVDTRNRLTSVDARIAGIALTYVNGVVTYRIDLPSTGNHDIRAFCGDVDSSGPTIVEFFDTTTSLGTAISGTPAYGSGYDATGVEYTAANWPGSNSVKSVSMGSTIFRVKVGATGSSNYRIGYVYIESAGGGAAGQPTMRRFGGVPGMGQGQSFGRSW